MSNILQKRLWHIFNLIDSISIVLQCEVEDMNERPNSHHSTMLDFENTVQNQLIKIKTFLRYKKFIIRYGCNCDYCNKIGFEDLKNMCKKGLSYLYMTFEEIDILEKNLQINEKSDKIFLNRLKMLLIKIITVVTKIQNYVSSDASKIPHHIVKETWKTLLKKYC